MLRQSASREAPSNSHRELSMTVTRRLELKKINAREAELCEFTSIIVMKSGAPGDSYPGFGQEMEALFHFKVKRGRFLFWDCFRILGHLKIGGWH
jgi:hypothetical protein